MNDDDKLDNGRYSWGPGDIWIEDEEAGIAERVGDISEEDRRRAEERGFKIPPNRRVIRQP